MSEAMEEIRQKAYVQGQQMQQWHHQQQRVVTDEALLVLAADFAHVSLFKANQQLSVVRRNSLRISDSYNFSRSGWKLSRRVFTAVCQ